MHNITPEKIATLPEERGFRLRGLEMTRIEVFVDAAFAFAVTMLVISFDEIPRTFDEMVTALKGTPAFILGVAELVWLWYEHNIWSRRYGLEDKTTIVLSASLVMVVLVYIYPMRLMFQGLFGWMTGGYLPYGMDINTFDELRFMFVFLGIGFALLCLVFLLLYGHALRQRERLLLNEHETFFTRSTMLVWAGSTAICLLAAVVAMVLPATLVPWSGFTYMLLMVWSPAVHMVRARGRK
jgi:hypothetical protein